MANRFHTGDHFYENEIQMGPQKGHSYRNSRGRGCGPKQHSNKVRSDFNTKRMEDYRFKTGHQTLAKRQDEIKSEIFAFVTNEQLEKLTSNVNKKSQMLPVTTRNVGFSTVSLLYTSIQYLFNT